MTSSPSSQSQVDAGSDTAAVHVTADNFTYRHPDREHPALAGLDLDISPGEKVLLTGASGAGKSTLLHALAGVLHNDDAGSGGDLLLDGMPPAQAPGRVGLLQQDPETQVVLSRIGDDVSFACENLAVPPAEILGRVQQALQAVGLERLPLEHPTAVLSGGQKQRLALAGILAMRPGLLLLDEPTALLDPRNAQRVRDSVVSAAEATGATLIVVEHRLATWADHVDTVIVLETGGGIRHRVPARSIYGDDRLRAELADAGLWVPGEDPLKRLPHWNAPAPHAGEPLLSAQGLAVHRQSPKKKSRRSPAPDPVLTDVDITLSAGSAVCLTGSSGAGKSTLLLTLAGLLPPHAGDLTAAAALKGEQGRHLSDSPHTWRSAELAPRIGAVFQEPEHQFLRSTVADELRLSAERARAPGAAEPLLSTADATARVNHLLQRLALTHLAHVNPFSLSGGEKRRLSVGTALAAGPDILMLDEPTFGQDARTFVELIELLREHLDSGGTVLAATHDHELLRGLQADEFDVDAAAGRIDRAPSSSQRSSPPLLSAVRDTSWLGRRSALAKLSGLALITVALIATIDPVTAAVVVGASFVLLPIANIGLGAFLKRIWIFALAALLAVWGAAIAAEESGEVLLDLGITTISTGSLEMGLALGARTFAIVVPSVLILSTTDPTDLADSLAQQLRLPARFVLGALAAMRLLGLLAQHWTTLGHARRARGLGNQFLSQSFGLLVQAIRMATRLAVTMESRGFGAGPRTWVRPTCFTKADGVVVIGAALIAAAATALAVALGTWNLVWT